MTDSSSSGTAGDRPGCTPAAAGDRPGRTPAADRNRPGADTGWISTFGSGDPVTLFAHGSSGQTSGQIRDTRPFAAGIDGTRALGHLDGPGARTSPDRGTHPGTPRVLVDTSVLAPEPLWLWMLALTDGIPDDSRPRLCVSRGVTRELRHALRRIDPQLTRAQADVAARLRVGSLTRISADSADPAPARSHVLDPDDAHLDAAALASGADLLVTDDVHAFASIPSDARGYALLTADEFLCTLVDTHSLSVAEALPRYRAHVTQAAHEVGVETPPGSPSHRLRRSRARRFAKLVVRAQRAPADSPDSPRRSAG